MCTGSDLVAGVARARLPYAENRVSWAGTACVRTRTVPACGVRSCGVGVRQESGQRHGCRGEVHVDVHGRLLLVESRSQQGARVWAVYGWTRGGLGDAVSSRGEGSGMRGRLGWCGVRWLFQGCCPGGRLRCLAVLVLLNGSAGLSSVEELGT